MDQTFDVLWTGGWDSSFRVLFSSLVEKREVRPHYIIDLNRKSSLRELKAISDVRRELKKICKDAADRVAELKITPVTEIEPEERITESFQRLKKQSHLGSQYDWLARYTTSNNISNLELSVHVDDKVYHFLHGKVDQDEFGRWKLKEHVEGDVGILSCFTFPILEVSKTQMRERAREFGFIDALEKSWFCFTPKGSEPCGQCNPCVYTIEEGMGYRLPEDAIFRYKTRHWGKAIELPLHATRKLYRKLTAAGAPR